MKTSIIIATWFVVLASGATTISWNIRNSYGAKLLAAFEAQDESHVSISFRGSQNAINPNAPDYAASIDFRTPARDPNDTNTQYVKKRVSLIIDAIKLAHEKKLLEDVKRIYHANRPSIDVNEPNEIGE